jgi:hypothetical protein
MIFLIAAPGRSGRPTAWRTGKDSFIWIRRNPLKSPESAKGIQEIQAFFRGIVWICLDLFGARRSPEAG